MAKRLPSVVYNPVSLAGAAIAAVSAGLIAFLMVVEFFAKESKPYMGILTFIILPSVLIAGLFIIAYGIWRELKLKKRLDYVERKFPAIDLNDPKQRRATLIFVVGTLVLLVASAFGSFKAYEYTDSDEFCGTMCHKVMEPEYTAYQSSPHSQVGCAKCHIGSGADWFVKAKISGSYQVYSVIFKKYSRPIPTPIDNLRPAQETCEQCHWPKHFYAEKKITLYHYLGDEKNTRSSISMLLRVGGGNPATGITTGIHWHMNIANDIWYYPSDESRQHIPYIKLRSKSTGQVETYTEKGFNAASIDTSKTRKFDCIDCHNRPSHIYYEPHKMINMQFSTGILDSTLPYFKSIAVKALEDKYEEKEEALKKIEETLLNFYQVNYPEVYKAKLTSLKNSIAGVQKIYSRNYFPYMNVSWKKFPNNIGHTYYDGCFRCHDGKHFSSKGKVISNDCNTCHVILSQTSLEYGTQVSLTGLDYYHPGNLNVKNQKCSDCHGVHRKKSEKGE